MTLVDKLKEKLHIGESKSSPDVPPKSSPTASTSQPAVPPKSEAGANPALPPKDTTSANTTSPTDTTSPKTDATTAAPATGAAAAATTSPIATKEDLPALPDKEVFDHSKVTVIFVLGGPGAGKGTQCENLVNDYGFVHLSAGDLLRAEQNRPGSTYGDMIKQCIVEGQIVPMEVTVKLLENAMRDAIAKEKPFPADSPLAAGWADGKGRFLIDGFPRKMDQALKFDEAVCESSFVLFISTTEEVMLQRLLERGKTSGRADDNVESIKKRFKTFVETSMPVVDHYRKLDKVVEIDSSPPVDIVYEKVRTAIDPRLGLVAPAPVGTETAAPAPIGKDAAPTASAATSQTQPHEGVPVLGQPAA